MINLSKCLVSNVTYRYVSWQNQVVRENLTKKHLEIIWGLPKMEVSLKVVGLFHGKFHLEMEAPNFIKFLPGSWSFPNSPPAR